MRFVGCAMSSDFHSGVDVCGQEDASQPCVKYALHCDAVEEELCGCGCLS